IAPDGLFEEAIEFAREHDILVVHDASYTETTFDGYVAPSFLATPGAREVGVEVFSLSKGYNMTGWRTAAIVGNAAAIEQYWRLKTNIDSGMFDAVQLAAAAALSPDGDAAARAMSATYQRRRDLGCDAPRGIVGVGAFQVLCTLEEVVAPEPPVRLRATFFEPGSVDHVAAEIRAGGDAVVAIGAPLRRPLEDADLRACDRELRRRGVFPLPF